MPTILIVGATGKQGGKAISTLFDGKSPASSDMSLRFITRNPDSAASMKLVERGAKPYKADLLDKESLKTALTGVDRAFLVTDAMAGEKEADQGITFVDAAKEVGVKHIVFTSVCAADIATNVPHFRTKYAVSRRFTHLTRGCLAHKIRSRSTSSPLALGTRSCDLSHSW